MDSIGFEDFDLDGRNYRLRRSGQDVKLERIPLELLLMLADRAGEVVMREQIIERLWGKEFTSIPRMPLIRRFEKSAWRSEMTRRILGSFRL